MACSACSLRMAALAALFPIALIAGLGGWSARSGAQLPEPEAAKESQPVSANILKQKFDLIDGTPTSFEAYKGKVVMVVNTAIKCGLTPQYEALEKLYRANKDRGFVIIGFPANNFMGQEPGTNEQILEFCTGTYDVTFPMAAKVSVKGEDAHPLYRQLTKLPEPLGGEPTWNFTKFLINRDGEVVARFEPRTRPDDEKVVSKLSELLGDG